MFWFRRLTRSFSVAFRATTTIRVEKKSFQEVGWIHRYARFLFEVLLQQVKIPPVTALLIFCVYRQSDTWVPGMAVAFALVCLLLILHSVSQSIGIVFLRALSLTSAHLRTQVGQLMQRLHPWRRGQRF